MPIKLPKGLKNRRKSSSPALEELENLPQGQGTFRVVERANGASRSIDGGFAGGRKLASEIGRPLSYGPQAFAREASPDYAENPAGFLREKRSRELFENRRKSGATVESFSTGPANHSSASSMRLSLASTVPSSTDLPLDTQRAGVPRKPIAEAKTMSGQPVPPIRNLAPANRSHTLGPELETSSSKPSIPPKRERAMTTSSASTATPPKLLESELALGSDMDDFSNMFDSSHNMDHRSIYEASSQRYGSPLGVLSDEPLSVSKIGDNVSRGRHVPSPITIDRTKDIEASPFSWTSHHSHDNLMGSSSPVYERTSPVQRKSTARRSVQVPRTYSGGDGDLVRPDTSMRRTPSPLKEISAWNSEKENRGWNTIHVHGGHQSESPKEEFSSKAVIEAQSPLEGHLKPVDDGISAKDKTDAGSIEELVFDPALAESAHLAAEYENAKPAKQPTRHSRRVMTPAQFERYKREQESKDESDSEESENVNEQEDDEDEAERTKQVMRQRRKQEARLSVYRQQMTKVTGEKLEVPPVVTTRPASARVSQSEPVLSHRLSSTHLDPSWSPASARSDDEEDADEDVPLGILAAHGFPNKNRPPTRLSNFGSSSGLSLQSDSQLNLPESSPSPAGSATGGQGPLPAFARKLPQDPYFGAGLVNPSNRESLSLGGGASSVRGMTPPGLHPGGLVGVIAGEERARALRRGSPSAQPSPELPAGMQQPMGGMPGMMNYGMPPMLSPNEQAQLQMQAQMGQMMQMQMQWMQQMQFMMQGQANGNSMPPHLTSSASVQIPQSASVHNLSTTFPPQQKPLHSGPQPQAREGQRAMSMMTPRLPAWNRSSSGAGGMAGLGGGLSAPTSYSPSIAPSERSNVGMAPRYRPVSLAPPVHENRSATMTSSIPRSMPQLQSTKTPQTTATMRAVPDDDEDERAWAEMKRQREARKLARKNKKDQQELAALYHGEM